MLTCDDCGQPLEQKDAWQRHQWWNPNGEHRLVVTVVCHDCVVADYDTKKRAYEARCRA